MRFAVAKGRGRGRATQTRALNQDEPRFLALSVVQMQVTVRRDCGRWAQRYPEGGPKGRKALAGGVSRRKPASSYPEPRRVRKELP